MGEAGNSRGIWQRMCWGPGLGPLQVPGLIASLASACCPGLSDLLLNGPHCPVFQECLLRGIDGDSDSNHVTVTRLEKWPGS